MGLDSCSKPKDYLTVIFIYLRYKKSTNFRIGGLTAVLSKQEVWAMLKSCNLLKHKVLIGLLCGCELRCLEVGSVHLADMDFDCKQLKVVQGKGRKNRYVPLSEHLIRGLIGPPTRKL
jgi:integrase